MKNKLLLPNNYKVIGWAIFLVFALFHLYSDFTGYGGIVPFFSNKPPSGMFAALFISNYPTIVLAGSELGLLIICFCKEKNEDEYISFLRLKSWQWSVLVSYIILFIANLVLFDAYFFTYMAYNLLSILFLFMVIFNVSLYRLSRERLDDEK